MSRVACAPERTAPRIGALAISLSAEMLRLNGTKIENGADRTRDRLNDRD